MRGKLKQKHLRNFTVRFHVFLTSGNHDVIFFATTFNMLLQIKRNEKDFENDSY